MRQEAFESLAGEPLLRMVHTRDGAWTANALLTHGTARHCKKFLKAIKGMYATGTCRPVLEQCAQLMLASQLVIEPTLQAASQLSSGSWFWSNVLDVCLLHSLS